MKSKLLLIIVGVLFCCGVAYAAPSITVDSVNQAAVVSYGDSLLLIGQPVTFYIRINNDWPNASTGLTNGFRVYSADGATWTSITGDTVGIGKAMFDGGFFINYFSNDGAISDTVGFGGFLISGTGVPAGWDDLAYTITTGALAGDIGDSICIDSSWYRPSNNWTWSDENGAYVPDWGGPYCWALDDGSDVVETPGNGLPTSFELRQNYPNPFNPSTKISFDVARRGWVNLSVYNVLGQRVATVVDKMMDQGSYLADWNGVSDNGTAVSTGIYFYKLEAGDFRSTKKMMLIK